MDETDKIAKLDSKNRARVRGTAARQALENGRPFFEELRDIYIDRMSRRIKESGEPDAYSAVAITVLKDIQDYLLETKSRGESAERKIQQLVNM